MVRWENKSPKDSDLWGPVYLKDDVIKLFYTSLRCKTNHGTLYCFREWITIYEEYRCFWNGTLCAISGNSESIMNKDIVTKIYNYIYSIKDRIPYHRCVFDICRISENQELIFKFLFKN